MKKMKNVFAILLACVMLAGTMVVFAEDQEEGITVYLSVSRYGKIVENKEGEPMAYVPVELTGQESYHLDDLFREAHKLYHPDGEEGYASSVSEWGLGIDKLWGDESYNFGYQVNSGTETVMGLDHILEHEDYVDTCIYKNLYPDTESYSFFNKQREEGIVGESVFLMLSCANGYDENWNTLFAPCADATIMVNGEATDVVTDENGVAELILEQTGTYVISAEKTKSVNEATVPAITSPICLLKIKENPAIQIIHNIAKAYTQMNLEEAGGNLPWIIADMAVYKELFPESDIELTEEQLEMALKLLTEFAADATKPGDLAKSILAIRALGYDARNIYTDDYQKTDIVEKLTALVDENAESVTNIYTLPYVIIALSQKEGYAEEETMEILIQSAVAQKEKWQDVSEGTDALTPMVMALAPFTENSENVKNTVEESIEILKSEQREDGLIDGFEGYEPASTGLAICAFSSVGVDAASVVMGEKSLIDGLLSSVNESNNGFPNAFATEQGFRGLLSWRLFSEQEGKRMYDFSDYPEEALNLSGVENCPVIFDISPDEATVTVEGYKEVSDNLFDLPEGEHTYQVTHKGYRTEEGVITVKSEDAEEHRLKEISVVLSRQSSGGSSSGGGSTGKKPSQKEDTTEDKEPQKEEAENKEPEQEEEEKKPEDVFSDVKKEDWFYSAVNYVYQKGLFSGTDRGFEPNTNMSRSMLAAVLYRLESPEEKQSENVYTDVPENAWYRKEVLWCTENGIVQGVSETEFAPENYITREQLAVMLYRYAQYKHADTETKGDISSYKDGESVSDYAKDAMRYAIGVGIMNGKGENTLAPKDYATRAEVATMFMRFAEAVK